MEESQKAGMGRGGGGGRFGSLLRPPVGSRDVVPRGANDQVRCDCTFADDGNVS